MSRSKRKTPIIGNCKASSPAMKKFRESENRAERRLVRQKLAQGEEILPNSKEYQNEWNSPRDGKHYFAKPIVDTKYMRLTGKWSSGWIQYWIKLMRK